MSLKQLERTLKLDLKAALGCTEPIAIALGTCKAKRLTTGKVTSILLRLSTNLLKNAMEVGIPGTGGQRGITLAAALGSLSPAENPSLTLLEGMTDEWLKEAKKINDSGIVHVELVQEMRGLYMDVIVTDENGNKGRCVISGSHENVILLERNGAVVFSSHSTGDNGTGELLKERENLSKVPFTEIWNDIGSLSDEIREYMLEGIKMNLKVADAGLHKEGFLNIGNIYNQMIADGWIGNDIINKAKALTSAAVDARMSGCDLRVMSAAGSGNQGLAISLPLYVLAKENKIGDKKLTEALAISYGVTSILKHHSGTLSAMCGCIVCAGVGLTAGITYILGGSLEQATAAINNMVGSITGVICDGAKVGCAMKLVCAVDSAFQSSMMALKGMKLPITNGVLGDCIETSLANIGRIAAPGMLQTDDQILAIMLGKPNHQS
ncbi:MAG: serine dehydratase subunit alpha family protein [Candidatus Riflebacteria bacterium]|nr:serine dehydratase subunit alpha family protein [Candidatus Riflebacteria bacterium]